MSGKPPTNAERKRAIVEIVEDVDRQGVDLTAILILAEVDRWNRARDESDVFDLLVVDRLMALWEQPWSEEAYGEAQMLVSRLRDAKVSA